jgi:rod shape-determining protein MreD
MSDARIGYLRISATIILALIFAIIPLPDAIAPARPNLTLLLVIYWSLSAPRIAGLLFAWLCGLAMDLLTGVILGQHALAFVLVAFIAHKRQLRMRTYTIWQQALHVLMLLFLHQFLVFWIDGVIDQSVTTWARWIPVVSGALLWPLVVAVLDTLNRLRR